MMDIDVKGLVPRFLWNDKNGHAMCRAIEAGLKDFLAITEAAAGAWGDPDQMPDWRLDEVAWEYNIPYDYTADIAIKREWIRRAYDLSRLYGTKEGVAQYLGAYFSDAQVQEGGEYGGDPFHYRINLYGAWTAEKVAWAINAANTVKNVRSVLDAMTIKTPTIETDARVYAGIALYGIVWRRFPAMEQPDIDAEAWLADESEAYLADERGILLTQE